MFGYTDFLCEVVVGRLLQGLVVDGVNVVG